MKCSIHDVGELMDYKFVIIFAQYKNKWVFCKHKNRITWDIPGGGIKHGETTLEAAKRELYEETGAIDFSIIPICDYNELRANGQVFFANINNMVGLPESEMESVSIFETFPVNLTFPEDTNELIPYVLDIINKERNAYDYKTYY
jgi:8-oxo-dGTP diphosphatase